MSRSNKVAGVCDRTIFPNRGPQAVSNTLWALGRMGAYHEPAVTAGLAAFRASHEAYKPLEVANLLWALTSFRHHPEGAFAELIKWWVRTGAGACFSVRTRHVCSRLS